MAQKQKNPALLRRETIGRESSNKKMLGDALTVSGVAVGSGIWTATRPSAQGFFWGIGLAALGAVTMVESQPGTFLESGGAGLLGANTALVVLHALNLAK